MMTESPFLIGPDDGSQPKRDTLVSLLASSRHFLLSATRGLSQQELDAEPRGVPNTIGALVAHVVAAETMFQNLTFHGTRLGDEQKHLAASFAFEWNHLAGQELAAYRHALDATRGETLRLLGGVDDDWLARPTTFMGGPSNVHYYWMHLIQDEARHTGQIILVRKYLLPTSDPAFNPYVAPADLAG